MSSDLNHGPRPDMLEALPLALQPLAPQFCAECREHHGGWCIETLIDEPDCPLRPPAAERRASELG